jgi:hypothetical protein
MPPQKNNLTIKAPLGGESRRFGFQSQDAQPFTTYYSNNMWPLDAQTGRAVTATRPPLDTFSTPTGTVNMLAKINGVASGKPLQSFVCAEDGQLMWWDGTGFIDATGTGAAAMETTAPLFAWPFLQKVYIPQFDDKPWVFNYVDGTVEELVESEGTIPNDLRMFVVWQGALWGAGRLDAPNIIYGSRVGDGTDWDFAAPITDTGGAFFSGGENEGLLNGPITALIPHSYDTMLVSTTEGFVAFRGHPRVTKFTSQHDAPYVLGQGAWCKTPDENLYYLSREGLIQVAPGDAVNFVNVSIGKLPDELRGLPYDYENPTISLEYDSLFHGIHITVRGASAQAWWFDLTARGFHRMTFSSYPQVMLDFSPIQNANQSSVLYGGTGLKRMDRFGSETIASEMTAGPFRMASDITMKSKMQRAKFVLGEGSLSGSGTVRLYAGADAEDAVRRYDLEDNALQYSITLEKLLALNNVCHPKLAGNAGMLSIESTTGRIVFEEMTLNLHTAGMNRIVKFTSQSLNCAGYATATPTAAPIDGPIDDGMEMINLANLPSEWWDLVNSTGSNIRVSDENNRFLPFDLMGFVKADTAGAISTRRPLPATPAPIRVWCCNQNLAAFPPGSEFGQYYAYPPWIIGNWPSGGGRNRLGGVVLPEIDIDPEDENPFASSGGPPEDLPDACTNFGNDPLISIMAMVTVPGIEGGDISDEKYIHPIFPIEACQGTEAGSGSSSNFALASMIVVTDLGGGDWTTQPWLLTYNPAIYSKDVGTTRFYSNESPPDYPTSTFAAILTLDDGLVASLTVAPVVGANIDSGALSGGASILPQPSFSPRHKGLPSNISTGTVESQFAAQIGSDTVEYRNVIVRGFVVRSRAFSEDNEDAAAYEHWLSTFESNDANTDYWSTWTFNSGSGTLSP